MKSLYLNPETWDMQLDASGNLKTTEGDYCIAQSVANAQRLFRGEAYFNTHKGIPYFRYIEGHMPPDSLIMAYLEQAARSVPKVAAARVRLSGFAERAVHGETIITTINGESINGRF